MKTPNNITTQSIAVSALCLFVPVFIAITGFNFLSYIPHGILARTMNTGGSYRTDVLEQFYSSQSMVLPLAVLVATIMASAGGLASSRANSSKDLDNQ
jgi:uncharacterized membrane protein YjfL (UPF0719 family)